MTEKPAAFPELSPQLRGGSRWAMLSLFGPGAIIACVTIGSGETVFASRGGAIYAYSMLWCFAIGAVCKGLQVYSAARFITLTGRGPLQSWVELPGPRGWFVWCVTVLTIFCMPLWLAALPTMLGEFSNWVVGIPNPKNAPDFDTLDAATQAARTRTFVVWRLLWGTLYIVVAMAFTWLQSYGFLEKVQTLIVALLLVCMILAALVAGPDWGHAFHGLVVPQWPVYEPWVENYPDVIKRGPMLELIVYIGVIGGGAQDYLGYVGMMREKAWGMMGRPEKPVGRPPTIATDAENVRRGRRWLMAPKIDVGMSTLAILVFTGCFVVLGAIVLHPAQIIPDDFNLLTEQSRFLALLAGESTAMGFVVDWMYKTGIFFAFFGTILGAFEIFVRTIHECVIALKPRLFDVPLRTFRFWTLVYCGGGGLVLLWACGLSGISPVKIVTPAALLGSGLVCGLWCFAMLWSDRVHLPEPLRMPRLLQIGVATAGVVLTTAATIGIVEYIEKLPSELQKWFG